MASPVNLSCYWKAEGTLARWRPRLWRKYALAFQRDIKIEFLHNPQVCERSSLPRDCWTIVASGFALISAHNLTFEGTCWGLLAAAENSHSPYITAGGGMQVIQMAKTCHIWNIPAYYFLLALFHHRFPVRVTHLQGWCVQTCALPLRFWAPHIVVILLMMNIMFFTQIFFVFPLSWSLRFRACSKPCTISLAA